MKNYLLIISILFTGVFFSCQEDLDIWDSATYDYAGRWYFKVTGEDGHVVKEYGSHLLHTFNSAADVPNELWIYDANNVFAAVEDLDGAPTVNVKGIQIMNIIVGSAAEFSSVDQTFEDALENVSSFPLPNADPSGEGDTKVIPNFFNKGFIMEGKILEGAGSSKSGSAVDSIYLKMKLFAGEIVYNSVYDDENDEYVWDSGSFSYYSEPDSIVILAGTRYTGFSEDEY
ncbi:lipid-binding protein [Thermophagus sp. OGC60D27]|uniref:lipid-binding protein n=1 Tax=Thermophagus sp. OGC60D27 TaxID=3458415 RepID=UPI004037D3A8